METRTDRGYRDLERRVSALEWEILTWKLIAFNVVTMTAFGIFVFALLAGS